MKKREGEVLNYFKRQEGGTRGRGRFIKWVKQKINNKRVSINPDALISRIDINGLNIRIKRPQLSDGNF